MYQDKRCLAEPLELGLDRIREEQRRAHIRFHKREYQVLRIVFGVEKHLKKQKLIMPGEKDKITALAFSKAVIPESYLPDCKLQCARCEKVDCDLPENWWNIAYGKEYRENNRELLRKKGKAYYQEHKAEKLQRQKEYRSKPEVKARIREYNLEYDRTHPEIVKKRHIDYRRRHPEKVAAWKKTYAEKNAEAIKRRKHEYYLRNKERIQAQHREYYLAHKERDR